MYAVCVCIFLFVWINLGSKCFTSTLVTKIIGLIVVYTLISSWGPILQIKWWSSLVHLPWCWEDSSVPFNLTDMSNQIFYKDQHEHNIMIISTNTTNININIKINIWFANINSVKKSTSIIKSFIIIIGFDVSINFVHHNHHNCHRWYHHHF